MSQLPLLSGEALVKILEKIGYQLMRQRGSHFRLSCPNRKSITVPNYTEISRGLLRKILRDTDITADEFNKMIT